VVKGKEETRMKMVWFKPLANDKGEVYRVHYSPNQLPADLRDGCFVHDIPQPENIPGKAAILYINPLIYQDETEEGITRRVYSALWYEYVDRPLTPDEQLQWVASLALKVTADKMQITAGGTDFATVTAEVPGSNGQPAFVMVNSPPAMEIPVQDGKVEIEVSADQPGLVEVSVAVNSDYGIRRGSIILKAVE